MFDAIVIRKDESGHAVRKETIGRADLPEGNVLVEIHHSTLNYKDALAISGRAPVVRRFPMVPGIDFAGRVVDSQSPSFKPGDMVLLNGWGVGESHWGGLAGEARVNADWLLPLPESLGTDEAMAIGTAGYTAMLCVDAIQTHGVQPGNGEVLVTGASGGVGSVAVLLLSRLGYRVAASTGKAEAADYLCSIGASETMDRSTLAEPGKPLAKERWAAVVDTVGGHTLANACASTRYGGVVAACGMAQSLDFPASVAPFILRGVHLAGIDSVYCPRPRRMEAWRRLAAELDRKELSKITRTIALDEVIASAGELLDGRITGRLVVAVRS